jgi:hypothetical protein
VPVDWTTTNLVVQVFAGFAGAHFAATALDEHRFGWLGHSCVGLIAGAVGGYFLQTIVLTVVTGSGSVNEPRVVEVAVIEALTGAVLGAIAMAAVGFMIKAKSAKSLSSLVQLTALVVSDCSRFVHHAQHRGRSIFRRSPVAR